MPTVFRQGPYRFFFYSGDRDESRHIPVEMDGMVARIWLDPLHLSRSGGISQRNINRILRIAETNRTLLTEAWNDHFND